MARADPVPMLFASKVAFDRFRRASHFGVRRKYLPITAGLLLMAMACSAVVSWGKPTWLRLRNFATNALASALETRFERPTLTSDVPVGGILVLGGNATRVKEGLRLARLHRRAKLVLSGPGPAEAAVARAEPSIGSRLVVDKRPTNTYENGLFSRDLLERRRDQRWLLVTSAIHMPRSAGVFAKLGLPVQHWPVYDTDRQNADGKLAAVQHEVLGLLAYWVWGRTSALFPAPQEERETASAR